MNGSATERLARALASVEEPVVVLDSERRLVAASAAAAALLGDAAPGRRLGEEQLAGDSGALVLFLDAVPALSAYQELRAGFTAAVSHELRTPLARLLALLESATLPGARVDDLVEQARQEVEQARELIDDVLFLGELETGREVVSLGRTPARPVVDEVVAAHAERAERAQVRVVARVPEAVELPLRPRMLRVVLENLVSNAVRHAGAGATCTVSAARQDAVLVLRVADDGGGVGAEDVARVFERFYRADRARSTRGTGLGLAIVKHVVTAAGGTVEARSAPGRGFEVLARFPA